MGCDMERRANSLLKDRLRKAPPRGFTFIEFLIVVCLIGIIATVALPMFRPALEDARLTGAAQETVTALEFAQMSARSTGRDVRVTIDAAQDMIRVFQSMPKLHRLMDENEDEVDEKDVEEAEFIPMGHPVNKGTDYAIHFSNENRFEGVDITGADFNAGNSVTFDAMGTPSAGGQVTLALGIREVVLTLNESTGKVTIGEEGEAEETEQDPWGGW